MDQPVAAKAAEIRRNFDAFIRLLPSLVGEHEGRCALLRHGAVVDFFSTPVEAQIAGNVRYEDGVFSIQTIRSAPEELGYFSHAFRSG